MFEAAGVEIFTKMEETSDSWKSRDKNRLKLVRFHAQLTYESFQQQSTTTEREVLQETISPALPLFVLLHIVEEMLDG